MKEKFTQFIHKIVGSLDTEKGGFSARKLTAVTVMTCVVAMHISWLKHAFRTEDFKLMVEILITDYSFCGLLLGLTSLESLRKIKQNDKPTESHNTDTAH
jgi:hypothetical protein